MKIIFFLLILLVQSFSVYPDIHQALREDMYAIDFTQAPDERMFGKYERATAPKLLSVRETTGKMSLKQNEKISLLKPWCKNFSELIDEKIVDTTSIQAHDVMITSIVQYSNRYLVSSSSDKKIKMWDLRTWTCEKKLVGHTDKINLVIKLHNYNLASCSDDQTIKIWNPVMGTCIQTLVGHTKPVNSITQLASGHLASCSWDQTIKIWDLETGECIKTLVQTDTITTPMIIGLVDGCIASCVNQTIQILNPITDTCEQTLIGHEENICAIIELEHNIIASGAENGEIRIWDLKTGKCKQTLQAHAHTALPTVKLFDGRLLSHSWGKRVEIFNLNTYECEITFRSNLESIIQLNNGSLAFGTKDGSIHILPLYSKRVRKLPVPALLDEELPDQEFLDSDEEFLSQGDDSSKLGIGKRPLNLASLKTQNSSPKRAKK